MIVMIIGPLGGLRFRSSRICLSNCSMNTDVSTLEAVAVKALLFLCLSGLFASSFESTAVVVLDKMTTSAW